jgi:hypothetical protein
VRLPRHGPKHHYEATGDDKQEKSQRGRQPLKGFVHGNTERKHCHKDTGEHKHMRMSFYCVVKCSSTCVKKCDLNTG